MLSFSQLISSPPFCSPIFSIYRLKGLYIFFFFFLRLARGFNILLFCFYNFSHYSRIFSASMRGPLSRKCFLESLDVCMLFMRYRVCELKLLSPMFTIPWDSWSSSPSMPRGFWTGGLVSPTIELLMVWPMCGWWPLRWRGSWLWNRIPFFTVLGMKFWVLLKNLSFRIASLENWEIS